jgi:hypothetical protein
MTNKELMLKYMTTAGNCPVCGGIDGIVVEDTDKDFCILYENCHCIHCKRQFSFKYELTEIINEDTEKE